MNPAPLKAMRQGLFLVGSLLICLMIQGCVPVATSAIAYQSAISSQEHAAYTDYLFAAEAQNKSKQQEGQPIQPILNKEVWLKEVYRPRLAYAKYYVVQTREGASVSSIKSFEVWRESEYPKILAQDEKFRQSLQRAGDQ